MALVLYEPTPILQVFREQQRTFTIPGLTPNHITINQDWNSHGVAAVVWEAAVVLATYLQTISPQMHGKRVLELGSGTGLSGIVACMLGATVTFTDLEGSLGVCETNVVLNLNLSDHNYRVRPLDWCSDLNVDWGTWEFDYIIGADLIYIEELFDDLVKTIAFFMRKNRNTVMFLSGKIRYEERYRKFMKIAEKKFDIERVHFSQDDGIYVLKILSK